MNSKIQLGKLGEKLAADFLSNNDCKVLDKNFNTRYGEIDLVASSGDEILFCEVKTRTSNRYGYPETAVNKKKIHHILKALRIYLKTKNINSYWRIDIISVELNMQKRKAKISWFKNVSVS